MITSHHVRVSHLLMSSGMIPENNLACICYTVGPQQLDSTVFHEPQNFESSDRIWPWPQSFWFLHRILYNYCQ